MNKPTIFFSHSSKDKDIVLSLKNKLDKVTGGVMDIFMSSDGQSIPFGSNWINKIEEGLKVANTMFVFVTENSISSGWIYFEAGYAYSKGIQVTPVGIGVDIGSLKAPLNLLQGFNITSEDSLNNFIVIINRIFDYHFGESTFQNSDYLEVIKNLSSESYNENRFEEMISKIECKIYSEYTADDGTKKIYNMNYYFNNIIEYLNSNNISFSKVDKYKGDKYSCIVACGVQIIYYRGVSSQKTKNDNILDKSAKISFYVSPYNFIKAFTLLNNLLQLFEIKNVGYVYLHLNENYNYITTAENGSSIISNSSEFDVDKSHIGGYICNDLGIKFCVFSLQEFYYSKESEYVASVVFDKNDICAENIIALINKLYDIGFIYNN